MHPEFELVDDTFCWCVENNLHRKNKNNTCCRIIHDVWHSSGIIENGGFHRFFDIANKAEVKSVVNAYKSVGLDRFAEIIRIAEETFNASKTKLLRLNIEVAADAIRHPINDELSLLEREFYDTGDMITENLAQYIKKMNPRASQ